MSRAKRSRARSIASGMKSSAGGSEQGKLRVMVRGSSCMGMPGTHNGHMSAGRCSTAPSSINSAAETSAGLEDHLHRRSRRSLSATRAAGTRAALRHAALPRRSTNRRCDRLLSPDRHRASKTSIFPVRPPPISGVGCEPGELDMRFSDKVNGRRQPGRVLCELTLKGVGCSRVPKRLQRVAGI